LNPILKDIWLTRLAMAIWIAAALAFMVVLATNLFAVVPPFTSLTLAWNRAPSNGPEITYVLRWGTNMGGTTWSTNVGTKTSITVTNPTSGTLYFSVVARSPDGIESDPSNTAITTNYPAAPLQLRILTNTTSSLRLEGTVDGVAWIYLATITNSPALVQMRQSMMLRTSTNLPPLPR
jgi:hypothetical protein